MTMEWDEQEPERGPKSWFKKREFGWGWTPITWQGWAIVIVPMFVTLAIVTRIISSLSS